MITLDDMVNRLDSYEKILNKYKYKHCGSGKKSWSNRYEHPDGTAIETRFSDWTFYNSKEEICGKTPDELNNLLESRVEDKQIT
jgi:hypothetical protein